MRPKEKFAIAEPAKCTGMSKEEMEYDGGFWNFRHIGSADRSRYRVRHNGRKDRKKQLETSIQCMHRRRHCLEFWDHGH